jgi:hypothetical protein
MRGLALIPMIMFSACSATGGPYPSLQPRAAERIDPRLPVERPMNQRPVSAALEARLRSLIADAQSASGAFDTAASQAEQLAASAGAPQGEGWVAAEEALSAAIAARRPVAEALAEIDSIGADALQTQGGLAPNDLAAIQSAASVVGGLDRRQAERVQAIQQRLGA